MRVYLAGPRPNLELCPLQKRARATAALGTVAPATPPLDPIDMVLAVVKDQQSMIPKLRQAGTSTGALGGRSVR
jgi:hypothetical protein